MHTSKNFSKKCTKEILIIVASACSWKTPSCLKRRSSRGSTTLCLLLALSSSRWQGFNLKFCSLSCYPVQIGEVGQQFSGKNLASGTEKGELPPGLVSLQEVVQLGGGDEEVASKNGKIKEDHLEDGEGWSITFEQFYASILTEPSLVDNFSQRSDIEVSFSYLHLNYLRSQASLKDYSSFGRPRVSSVETKDNSRSVFYV